MILQTSIVLPGKIFPGQWAMPGTRIPPSHVVPFPHLRSPALPPLILLVSDGLYYRSNTKHCEFGFYINCECSNTCLCNYPLSAVKNKNVLSITLKFSRAIKISPTAQSISVIASPNMPLIVVLVKFFPANWGWCVCWKAKYRKNAESEATWIEAH